MSPFFLSCFGLILGMCKVLINVLKIGPVTEPEKLPVHGSLIGPVVEPRLNW